MKRKFVLATILCLAVAALGIGAAPAIAAGGCTCHTDEPPTATAAHEPFVASVTDCTTCHVGWVVPHPSAGSPGLGLALVATETGSQLGVGLGHVKWLGGLSHVTIAHPDVVVYLQQRPWGEIAFTDLGQGTTDSKGHFALAMTSAPPFTTYRAIAQGHVLKLSGGGTALFEPKVSNPLLPTPELTLKLLGVKSGIVRLGSRVTATGTVKPPDMGEGVLIRVQRRVAGKWVGRIAVTRVPNATGTYSLKFPLRHRGLYRVWSRTPWGGGAETWNSVITPTRHFRVK